MFPITWNTWKNFRNMNFLTVLLCLSACMADDPCPPKAELAPCTCTHEYRQDMTKGSHQQMELTRSNSTVIEEAAPTASPNGGGRIRRRRDTHISKFQENNTTYTVVDCKVWKSRAELVECINNGLHRKHVSKLVVSNVPPCRGETLARFPSGWLRNVRVKHFEVKNSRMCGDFIWNGYPFESQAQSLVWFSANKCSLSGSLTYDTVGTMNMKGLNSLHFLQGVNLSDNFLTAITASAFRNPPANLSTVILSHNSIYYVEAGAFSHIPKLKFLQMSHNLLESVARTMFPTPAKYLTTVDLSWNSVVSLPPDLFDNMAALKSVDFSSNFLYSLPEKPWALMWDQLKHIDLTGNFIACNCDLLWLCNPPSVSNSNTTNTTTSSVPSLEQTDVTIRGVCSETVDPQKLSVTHPLATLKRYQLNCDA